MGFSFVLLEVQHLHADILTRSVPAWLPIIYCASALVLIPFRQSLFIFGGIGHKILVGFFILGIILGLYGVAAHTRLRFEPFQRLLGRRVFREHVPRAEPLPPLVITGLSALALVALSLQKEKSVRSPSVVVGIRKEQEFLDAPGA